VQRSFDTLLVVLQTFLVVLLTFLVILDALLVLDGFEAFDQIEQLVNVLSQALQLSPHAVDRIGDMVFEDVDLIGLLLQNVIEALSNSHRMFVALTVYWRNE
jgi:hypothetical protein